MMYPCKFGLISPIIQEIQQSKQATQTLTNNIQYVPLHFVVCVVGGGGGGGGGGRGAGRQT